MFQEIKFNTLRREWEEAGERMVAKESKFNEDERSKEKFHKYFCRVQTKAGELAAWFNEAVMNTPLLLPSQDEVSLPPPILSLTVPSMSTQTMMVIDAACSWRNFSKENLPSSTATMDMFALLTSMVYLSISLLEKCFSLTLSTLLVIGCTRPPDEN